MRLRDIVIGDDYLIRVRLPGRAPAWVAKRVTVVERVPGGVAVESLEPVCVNLHRFQPGRQAAAMINGRLRWELRPRRVQCRAVDVLRPYAALQRPAAQPDAAGAMPSVQSVSKNTAGSAPAQGEPAKKKEAG